MPAPQSLVPPVTPTPFPCLAPIRQNQKHPRTQKPDAPARMQIRGCGSTLPSATALYAPATAHSVPATALSVSATALSVSATALLVSATALLASATALSVSATALS